MTEKDNIIATSSGQKNLSDVLSEIYSRSNTLHGDIKSIIETFAGILKSSDADLEIILSIAPIIDKFLNTSIKNDEQLIKVAANINKLISDSNKTDINKIDTQIDTFFDELQELNHDSEKNKEEIQKYINDSSGKSEIGDDDIEELEEFAKENTDDIRSLLG